MPALLEVDDLHVAYGKVQAVRGVSFAVEQGQVVTLIGANGAGKTTTLRALSGLQHPVRGSVRFNDRRISGVRAHEIVALGLAHSPEGRRIFARLTIEQNLLLGAHLRKDREVGADLRRGYEMFPVLGERSGQLAGTLSGGEQQMLAIARALMCRPALLMLDEPSMGLSPLMTQQVFAVLRRLREDGMTILLVEQNAHVALALADRGYVLENGRIALSGSGAELLGNDQVRKAYLGED
jgi:branched-chain amino acid transport system ATP-binding protein